MCGIVGYIGNKNATPILINSLKNLEYRGYDSSGVGVIDLSKQKIAVKKIHGKISNLQNLLKSKPFPKSHIGISHTRWATHGVPSTRNAHPHISQSQEFLIVHNGIIENYESLRSYLKKKGYKFSSDTDTEVIVHLIERYYKGDFLQAVQKTINKLEGAFALGIISPLHPDTLIAARVGSPLIIGVGKGENFIASDVPAILEHTKKIIYLDDGQVAEIKNDYVNIYDFLGKKQKYRIDTVKFKVDAVAKQGYPHFMLKEIHEQPDVVKKMISSCVKKNSIQLSGLNIKDKQLSQIKNIVIVACGTAYHAGLVGKYIIEQLSSIPASIDVSSEFRYRNPIIQRNTVVLAISQSGETADTLAAVREAKSKGAKIISVCNVLGSSLTRESDGVLYTHAGPEIGVASTKAYTAQLCMLYLLGIKLGIAKKTLNKKQASNIIKDLKKIPSLYSEILHSKNRISKIARINSHFGCFSL